MSVGVVLEGVVLMALLLSACVMHSPSLVAAVRVLLTGRGGHRKFYTWLNFVFNRLVKQNIHKSLGNLNFFVLVY